MLTALRLRNFQAHSDLVVRFETGITVITGATDAGKSAIIRALVWLLRNPPGGLAFLRHGEKKVEAALKVDGHLIRRIASSAGNTYLLDDKPFKAIGTDVPPEIAQLLRVEDINIQHQHDGPFWFNKSGGDVSRQLNQIVDLGVIDRITAFVATALRHARAEVSVVSERKAQLEEQLEAQAPVKEMRDDVVAVYDQYQELLSRRKAVTNLETTVAHARVWQSLAATELPDLTPLDTLYRDATELAEQVTSLEAVLAEVRRLEEVVSNEKDDLGKLEASFHKQFKGVCPLCHQKIPSH